MDSKMFVTIVTSAAVGALMSAIVSLIGQGLERRARRRELLLSKAIDLAFRRSDLVLKVALENKQPALLKDDVSLAAEYFAMLQHIIEKNELPAEFKEKEKLSFEKHKQ